MPRRAEISEPIYADWNATTPPAPEVLDEMRAAAEAAWANPSSVHGAGRAARARVEAAREAIAALLGFEARDVVLTSGGTEANNIALTSLVLDPSGAPVGALIVGAVEHPSVLRTAEALAARGVEVVIAESDDRGVVTSRAVEAALGRARSPAAAIAVQAANHETGVVHPIPDIAALAAAGNVPLHADVVQAAGRLDPASWAGADVVAIAAHKIRGPKGIGALVSRPGVRLRRVLHGGSQERGIRPGTQDPVAAAGFACAARLAVAGPARYGALAPSRDRLESTLVERYGAVVNGGGPRAPHVSNLSFPGWSGPELVAALDLEGVHVSSGAACSAGTTDPSAVVRAMAGDERARGAVRISLGPGAAASTVDRILLAFEAVLARAR